MAPGYSATLVHEGYVGSLAKSLAEQINRNARGKKAPFIDPEFMKMLGDAHDSLRHFSGHDVEAIRFWQSEGFPKISKLIGTGESWTLKNYPKWSLEKRLLAFCDHVCRGVKVRDYDVPADMVRVSPEATMSVPGAPGGKQSVFANGFVPSSISYKLLVSQRPEPERVDNLTRERLAVLRFEKDLGALGVDSTKLIKQHARGADLLTNPPEFASAVQRQIESVSRTELASRISDSMKRLRIKSVAELRLGDGALAKLIGPKPPAVKPRNRRLELKRSRLARSKRTARERGSQR